MSWKSVADFVGKKFNEYKEEVLEAKDLQDNQKKFNELYISKEKQIAMIAEAQWKEDVDKKKAEKSNNTSTGGGGPSGTYSGSIQEQFWQFFLADGYSKQAIAGMMGNIQHESNFDAATIEKSNGWGLGLCQWTNPNGGTVGRRKNLEDFLAAKNTDTSNYVAQFEFLKSELDSYYLSIMPGFKTYSSVYDAVETFCWKFERPAPETAGMNVRHSAADGYYAQFKDATFSSGSSSASSSGLVRPCSGGSVSSEYGPRTLNGVADDHLGIDIATTGGALAAASGTVVSATWHKSYGNYIVLDHGSIGGKNIKTLYAHLSSMEVTAGNTVKQAQKIGVIGNTGNSFGVHLHFEVKINDARTNPRDYVTF